MIISERLRMIAGMVTKGYRAADVCCDHGFVPIWLVENGISPSAIASDIRKGPLMQALEHIREHRLEDKIEARLGDGLETLTLNEADSIIISGIGGILLTEILERGEAAAKSARELILSPQSDLFLARTYLKEHGYFIEKEKFLKEDGKFYFILYVTIKEDDREWTDAQLTWGREIDSSCTAAYREYLLFRKKKQEEILQKILENCSAGYEGLEAVKKTIAELEQILSGLPSEG